MSERRTLTAGLKTPAPPVDPNKEKEFVYGQKPRSETRIIRQPGNQRETTRRDCTGAGTAQHADERRFRRGAENGIS